MSGYGGGGGGGSAGGGGGYSGGGAGYGGGGGYGYAGNTYMQQQYRSPMRQQGLGAPPVPNRASGGGNQPTVWERIKAGASGTVNAMAPPAYHRGAYYANKALEGYASEKNAATTARGEEARMASELDSGEQGRLSDARAGIDNSPYKSTLEKGGYGAAQQELYQQGTMTQPNQLGAEQTAGHSTGPTVIGNQTGDPNAGKKMSMYDPVAQLPVEQQPMPIPPNIASGMGDLSHLLPEEQSGMGPQVNKLKFQHGVSPMQRLQQRGGMSR